MREVGESQSPAGPAPSAGLIRVHLVETIHSPAPRAVDRRDGPAHARLPIQVAIGEVLSHTAIPAELLAGRAADASRATGGGVALQHAVVDVHRGCVHA